MPYVRKQAMQLASKMRFVSAQLVALLTDDLWRRNAEHANAMAARLAAAVDGAPGVTVTDVVQANAVFAILDPAVTAALQQENAFYVWNEATGQVRWMTSWETTEDDVDGFAARIRELARPLTCQVSSRPCSMAYRVSSTRLCRCSLRSVDCTWFCTVRCEITSCSAIWR